MSAFVCLLIEQATVCHFQLDVRFSRMGTLSIMVKREDFHWNVISMGPPLFCSLLDPPYCDSASHTAEVKVLGAQSRPTLCDPMNCSPPGSSVQPRILE